MNNIELLRESAPPDFRKISDVLSNEETLTPAFKEFENKNRNPLLILIAGSILWSSPCDAEKLRNSISLEKNTLLNNFDSFLQEYETINSPLLNYYENLSQKVYLKKNTKKELIRDIVSFRSLQENWDGFGALPLEVESAAHAIELIDLLGSDAYGHIDEIFPNPHGTLSILWINNSGEKLSLEIGNSSFSYYVEFISKDTEYFNNKVANDFEVKKINEFIKVLF